MAAWALERFTAAPRGSTGVNFDSSCSEKLELSSEGYPYSSAGDHMPEEMLACDVPVDVTEGSCSEYEDDGDRSSLVVHWLPVSSPEVTTNQMKVK
mmetsp:Transcript_40948/g.55790  ORF Transcript_40948/g.55790 Transcript_40948/m.55790 type:complete len:96 (-) Transcript_40948:176-463(-)